MSSITESERFMIVDKGDGWLKLERKGGDAMSIQARELPELIELLERIRASRDTADL